MGYYHFLFVPLYYPVCPFAFIIFKKPYHKYYCLNLSFFIHHLLECDKKLSHSGFTQFCITSITTHTITK